MMDRINLFVETSKSRLDQIFTPERKFLTSGVGNSVTDMLVVVPDLGLIC